MNNQSEKGLMSKTKKELVEIILRKDDVERDLRSKLETTEKDLKFAQDVKKDLEKKIQDSEKNHIDEMNEREREISALQDELDETRNYGCGIKDENTLLKKQIRITKRNNIILTGIVCVLVIAAIIAVCI